MDTIFFDDNALEEVSLISSPVRLAVPDSCFI